MEREETKNLMSACMALVALGTFRTIGYFGNQSRKHTMEIDYNSLPEKIKIYDKNKDRVIDSREARGLDKAILSLKIEQEERYYEQKE